jgi:hypothetical protein
MRERKGNTNSIKMKGTTMEKTEITETRSTLGRDDETSSEGGEVSSCQ